MASGIRETSPETRLLIKRLKEAKVGEKISYADLSEAAGVKITGASYQLTTARNHLLRESNYVFDAIRGQGVVRLSDDALVTTESDKDITKSRRHAKKAAKKLSCVEDYSALSPSHQMAHTIKISFFGAIAHMARGNQLEKAAQAVGGRSGELPIAETLKAFGLVK